VDESGNVVLSTEFLIREVNKAISSALNPVFEQLDALTKRIQRIESRLGFDEEEDGTGGS
jgi:hypothetical protein